MEIERFLLSLLSTVLSGFLLERVVECLLECRSCPKKILLLLSLIHILPVDLIRKCIVGSKS